MSNPYTLAKGPHVSPADGRCAMEWVAFIAGEKHSDRPVCVSRFLQSFCIAFNDRLGDEDRQRLRPYLARTIGTRGDGLDAERERICREMRTSSPAATPHPASMHSPVAVAGVAADYASVDETFELLDRMLPKVTIDLPEPVVCRVRELEASHAS